MSQAVFNRYCAPCLLLLLMFLIAPMGTVTAEESVKPVAATKPSWRIDKPFGEKISERHWRHNYVGGMEFVFPEGWSVAPIRTSHQDAIKEQGSGDELKHDQELSHDKISSGAFLVARFKSSDSFVSLTVFLERIPQDMTDEQFVNADQKVRFGMTIREVSVPEVDRAASKSRAWIGGRSCAVIDIDGIYRKGGLQERYYYVPVLPDEYLKAKEEQPTRYVYVLRFRAKTNAARETLTLKVPGMVLMAGPLACDGYLTQDDAYAQNAIFKSINQGKNLVDSRFLSEVINSNVKAHFLFETTMKYVGDANSGSLGLSGRASRRGANAAIGMAWTDLKEVVKYQQTLRLLVHDHMAVKAWQTISARERKLLKRVRPDFVSAVEESRQRLGDVAF